MGGTEERFHFFGSGAEFYPEFKKILAAARREILINTYAFHNDRIGREFKDILIAKAQEGVRVRVIFDSFGSWYDQRGLLADLRAGGAEARLFRDKLAYAWRRPFSSLYRDHARLMLIDRKYLGLGGMGIGEIYYSRKDCFCLGKIRESAALVRLFDCLWALAKRPGRLPADLREPLPILPGISAMISGPYRSEAEIYEWLISRIRSARDRIVIVATWFFPSAEILAALLSARARGVKISLVTPLATDREKYDGFRALPMSRLLSRIEWYGTREYFHQKYFLADEEWCMGSANFDILSLRRNYELDICGRDGAVLSYLENDFRGLTAKTKPRTSHPTPVIFRHLSSWSYRLLEFFFTASPIFARRLRKLKEAPL